MLLGGIEAGGTKMVCAITDENGQFIDRIELPTKSPRITVGEMIAYFKRWDIKALGIGCFGPLDLDEHSGTYGSITRTPKKEWANYPIVDAFKDALNIPVGIDTDVNAAVLAEVKWGNAKGCQSAIYITIGTGVGVGVYCNGQLMHGLIHPEAGHMLIKPHENDHFEGVCPFHSNCVEGLASGQAIAKRWNKPAKELEACKEVWELEAYYIAEAIANYILVYSPQKIILWGGVMHQTQLFDMVRKNVKQYLNGYVYHKKLEEDIENYIVAPGLGENPGILGAILIGLNQIQK